ncbi:integrase arm-type DNA-binding domain-containing protein [Psychrobacter sp. Ps1]|uniref:tyrosine-type recombinase/integrase n=1 Tax=Psychrobacter sp. Ps1 TaxID=2790955 RepID=UPI001EDD0E3B|nr:integrase arm-type DNA-binding domain-containing protein [Psychrobacter sp. Ps1]MCG3841633.1 integrase arm-type DNA-binding domain-containing protein [Psychrobacter sp. Ps1]
MTTKSITIKSDRTIKSIMPPTKGEILCKVSGHPKLFLRVNASGAKLWLYRYTHPVMKSKHKLSLGSYPAVTLAHATAMRLEYEQLLQQGIDPKAHREQQIKDEHKSLASTFEKVAWHHFEQLKNKQKATTLKRKHGRYELLCSYLGDTPIGDIEPLQMLEVLRDIQANSLKDDGTPTDKADRCAVIASDIFNHAIVHGYATNDPARIVKPMLDSYRYGNRPSITTPSEFGQLMRDVETLKGTVHDSVFHSIKLLSLLFIRNGDLRRLRWSDVNLDMAQIDLQPMKGHGASKLRMVKDMIVPLSRQAVEILKAQQAITGHTDYVFHSDTATKNNIINENAANDALKSLGYQGTHCAHGFRASARTMLRHKLKYDKDVIEMALGHITRDPNGTAYDRWEFVEERSQMMQEWSDYIDNLKTGKTDNVIKMPRMRQNDIKTV